MAGNRRSVFLDLRSVGQRARGRGENPYPREFGDKEAFAFKNFEADLENKGLT